MRSDWWKFNESMTSGTRPPVRNIRRGEEGVRASDLGPSENQPTNIFGDKDIVPHGEIKSPPPSPIGNPIHSNPNINRSS